MRRWFWEMIITKSTRMQMRTYYTRLARLTQRAKLKYSIIIAIVTIIILYVAGVLTWLFEKDFNTEFTYPYEGDVEESVLQLKNNQTPSVKVINSYNYSYLTDCKRKCPVNEPIQLVYIIKSSTNHFKQRLVIRQTWGYENRFSDVVIRTVFLLGVGPDYNLQRQIESESLKYNDIIQADFLDAYFNNTIKTMMGFKWAATVCPHSKFYMFVDDDMYVSTKNVLRYLRHPTKYPDYLNDQTLLMDNVLLRTKRQIETELPDGIRLYTGYVKRVSPLRDLISKWYITLAEYPYNYFPLFATAGAYVVSKDALIDMYYTSFYTKHFRFDDVFLGLVALKAGITPYNTDHVYMYKKKYSPEDYKYVIASHGYEDPVELATVWTQQKELGNV